MILLFSSDSGKEPSEHQPGRRIFKKYTNAVKSYTAWVIIGVSRFLVQIHNSPKYAPMKAATKVTSKIYNSHTARNAIESWRGQTETNERSRSDLVTGRSE